MSNRIQGTSSYSEVQNGFDFGQTINFRYIGIRTVTNSTDVNYRATKQIGFFARIPLLGPRDPLHHGVRHSGIANSAKAIPSSVSNHLHAGVLGVRFRPWKPFSISLDGEIGRANFPLTPVSEKQYHNLNGRAEYRTRRTQLSTNYRQAYNLNAPFTFSTFNSHSRQYSANASWAPNRRHLVRRELHEAASGYARRHRVFREHRHPAAVAVGIPVVLHEQYSCGEPRASALATAPPRRPVRRVLDHEGHRRRKRHRRSASDHAIRSRRW